MQINDGWKIKDAVSGLCFKIKVGKTMDVLHVESLPDEKPKMNRDFFFKKDGKFDGTGSCVS